MVGCEAAQRDRKINIKRPFVSVAGGQSRNERRTQVRGKAGSNGDRVVQWGGGGLLGFDAVQRGSTALRMRRWDWDGWMTLLTEPRAGGRGITQVRGRQLQLGFRREWGYEALQNSDMRAASLPTLSMSMRVPVGWYDLSVLWLMTSQLEATHASQPPVQRKWSHVSEPNRFVRREPGRLQIPLTDSVPGCKVGLCY